MIRALFIRHGQSTANIGIFSRDFAQVPLTALGEQQAAALAASWQQAPDLIAVSPFLRAQQTAAPTIARFPHVPVETWEIYEFTYWDPANWDFTAPESYPEVRARFWSEADPGQRKGPAAETFSEFLRRAGRTLKRLEAQPDGATVMLFSHGHFIQAVRFEVLSPELSDRQKMQVFDGFDQARKVLNTQCVVAEFDGTRWTIDSGA
jgi:broad specificity phosphatase PhoE